MEIADLYIRAVIREILDCKSSEELISFWGQFMNEDDTRIHLTPVDIVEISRIVRHVLHVYRMINVTFKFGLN